jgi:NAD(P)-dependent dehydrogenase (short-subunit alcohol dehydrogenase family)
MNSAHAYKISKAAMNMLTMQYAVDYKSEGLTAFAISPGVRYFLMASEALTSLTSTTYSGSKQTSAAHTPTSPLKWAQRRCCGI